MPKTSIRTTCVLLVGLLLTGCADTTPDVWHKAGASQDDFNKAFAACTDSATVAYPPNLQEVEVETGYNAGAGSGCGFSPSSAATSCASSGNYVPATKQIKDMNIPDRNLAVKSCLTKQGWQPG